MASAFAMVLNRVGDEYTMDFDTSLASNSG